MKKFNSKNLQIEAIEFDGSYEMFVLIKGMFPDKKIEDRYNSTGYGGYKILILDNRSKRFFELSKGDYLAVIMNNLFIFPKDIFEAMYEPVD